MDLTIGQGEFSRDRGKFVPWRQVNMLLEETSTDPKGYNLLSRPPLAQFYDWGDGPIQSIFWKAGAVGGSVFAVSGDDLYKDGVLLGAIDGTGPVSWAANKSELVVTRGKTAYSWNGTNLAAIAFPDGADVRAVNFMSGFFIYVRKGTGRFYWSALNDGRSIDALDFATAESSGDDLFDIKKTGDVFWMLGADSGEAWMLTGDSNLPWTRISQRTLGVGVQDTGCAEEIGGTVYFLGSDGAAYRIADAEQRVSNAALDEKLRASATGSTFQFKYEGKLLFCMRLDSGTFALDIMLNHQPVEFVTSGRDQWAAQCCAQVGSEPLFGDDTTGQIWCFDVTSQTDSDEAEFPRYFSAGVPLNTKPLSVSNVLVDGNAGDTDAETGENADPILEARYSRDGGRTFGDWRAARWGRKGQSKRQARFGGAGSYGPPGFLAEFRMLACVPLRVAGARINESLSGRGW